MTSKSTSLRRHVPARNLAPLPPPPNSKPSYAYVVYLHSRSFLRKDFTVRIASQDRMFDSVKKFQNILISLRCFAGKSMCASKR